MVHQAVDYNSSSFVGRVNIALDADHMGMNKFRSKEDHNYVLVMNEIKRMVDNIQQG